jgi:hypothetical protein
MGNGGRGIALAVRERCVWEVGESERGVGCAIIASWWLIGPTGKGDGPLRLRVVCGAVGGWLMFC